MKKKNENKLPVNIALGVEDNDVLNILTDALASLPGFAVSLDCMKMVGFSKLSEKVEVLIICEKFFKKENLVLHNIKEKKDNLFKIFVVLSRFEVTEHTNYLDFADGYIFYDENLHILPEILRSSKGGYYVFPNIFKDKLIDMEIETSIIAQLSLFECALLQELDRSSSERVVARRMGRSSGEIRTELRKLYKKLNFSLSAEVKDFARRHTKALHRRRRELVFQKATNLARSNTVQRL